MVVNSSYDAEELVPLDLDKQPISRMILSCINCTYNKLAATSSELMYLAIIFLGFTKILLFVLPQGKNNICAVMLRYYILYGNKWYAKIVE